MLEDETGILAKANMSKPLPISNCSGLFNLHILLNTLTNGKNNPAV